jgi:N12 class adenine-specific DNA methylase
VADTMRELIKLNVQGHVHAQELYSALNILQRTPPGPLLAFLAGSPRYKHVGDLHYRMSEAEAGDD